MGHGIAFQILNLLELMAALVGCYQFKKLTLPYKFLIITLIIGYISETIPSYFGESVFFLKILEVIFSAFEVQLFYVMLLLFMHKSSILKKALIFLFFSLIIILLELKIWGALSMYTLLIDFVFYFFTLINCLDAFAYTVNQKKLNDKRSRLLILVPIMVFCIYYIILVILMFFLYNQKNQQLFSNLYAVVQILNFLSYISYILAFVWIPKKEEFL
jgi:hypothetical protein